MAEITIEAEVGMLQAALHDAGFKDGDKVRVTVSGPVQEGPRRTIKDVFERAHRLALLEGMSERVLQHSREVREGFAIGDKY